MTKRITKDGIIASIQSRIETEHRKHKNNEGLEWAKVAAMRIYSELEHAGLISDKASRITIEEGQEFEYNGNVFKFTKNPNGSTTLNIVESLQSTFTVAPFGEKFWGFDNRDTERPIKSDYNHVLERYPLNDDYKQEPEIKWEQSKFYTYEYEASMGDYILHIQYVSSWGQDFWAWSVEYTTEDTEDRYSDGESSLESAKQAAENCYREHVKKNKI